MSPIELESRIDQVVQRLRLVERRATIAKASLLAVLLGLACYVVARNLPTLTWLMQGAFAAGALALLLRGVILGTRSQSDRHRAVSRVEAQFPELQARLLTAIEQQPDVWSGKFNLFQARLFQEVGAHAVTHDWPTVVSPGALTRTWRQQSAALGALVIVAWGLASLSPLLRGTTIPASQTTGPIAGRTHDFTVDPGHTAVERHQHLLVLVRFQSEPPRDVVLQWQPANGPSQQISLTKSLDDPVFAGRVAEITDPGTYRLEFDEHVTEDFAVTVFDLPALVDSSLTISAPAYTRREPQTFVSASVVTAIEGSQVRLQCTVNQPLARVELRDERDQTVQTLSASPDDPRRYAAQWIPDRSRRWQLILEDAAGRQSRESHEFQIDVAPNRRPDIKLAFPGQDLRVSALQEVTLEARVSDDFGLLATGVVIDPAGGDQLTFPLSGELAGGAAHPLNHPLALEEFQLEPGNVVSYAFFADDHGPDGQPRRTLTELFFLEIRPYEETFRQMEAGGGQSGPQASSGSPGQTLDKLIELQKQIVTATWNLQRRDVDFHQPEEIAIVKTLTESQTQAQDDFEKLAEGLEGAVPVERIRGIVEAMTRAIDAFTTAESTRTALPLEIAAQATRTAFQGLLRLRPTDHRLMQGGQSGGGAGGGGSMSQQQLEQLELDEQANRYEREKSSRGLPENSEQKEQMAVLNRLKELAQRQQGINEKLKELDAELHAARSEAAQRELDRQLKQLREEQQDLLQEADLLRNRLEQSPQRDQTTETRQQLEQTRQQLVDAAESLKEGKLGQALSSGTRAERDLQKLQDDFRKQSSAQLAESLQQLRHQARELTDTAEKSQQELTRLNEGEGKSLRQRQQRERLAQTFQEQQKRLDDALKNLQELVQSAETSEPLAAKQLYEAARQTQQQKTSEALNAAAQLVRQGFLPEAGQVEELARQGLQTLREGIEAAAESILGDEVADLKRAKRELAELTKELQAEMRAVGQAAADDPAARTETLPGNNSEEPGKTPGRGPGTTASEAPTADPAEETPSTPNQPGGVESAAGGDSPPGNDGDSRGGLRGSRKRKPSSSQQPGPGSAKSGQSEGSQSGGPGGQGGPLTGGNYADWADRLRDVETLVSDPELQTEIAKVREQARQMRAEFKRHSKTPNWELVEEDVRQPLVELQRRIAEELARRESPDALVPTDRDPVHERYRELVRKYYERLGGGGK